MYIPPRVSLGCLQAYAVQRAAVDNLAFVPPYDDPYTIAGQGTIGDEILRQVQGPARSHAAHAGAWDLESMRWCML